MGRLDRSAISLRFSSDDLDPAVITNALGVEPDLAYAKGGAWATPSGRPMVGQTGLWSRSVADRSPADFDNQVAELFALTATDVSAWSDLSARYRGELFVGLFMRENLEGLSIAPPTLAAIAARGLALDLDMYGPFGEAE